MSLKRDVQEIREELRDSQALNEILLTYDDPDDRRRAWDEYQQAKYEDAMLEAKITLWGFAIVLALILGTCSYFLWFR